METSDDRQLLVVVFDVNPVWWGLKALDGEAQITKCLDSLLVFFNSFLMLRHDNDLAIIASHSTKSVFLYPNETGQVLTQSTTSDSKYTHFVNVDNTITEQFRSLMMSGCKDEDIRNDSLIAGSMAIALCYIHRKMNEAGSRQKLSSRILVVKAADDAASQYMSFMNVIFAAQKEHIVIDACVIGEDSGLLQQACDMTGGLYLKVKEQGMLLQYLLTAFLAEAELRKSSFSIGAGKARDVDYRAACFCHRSLVDVGFVCSVCLSIFCQFSPICSTCETAFKPPPMALKSRRKRKPGGAQGGRSESPHLSSSVR